MNRALIGTLACVLLAGCGAQGEAFQPRTTPASKAVVYVYRPYSVLTSQAAPMITCGHESIELDGGGFDEFLADSESVTCSAVTDPTAQLKFDARAGEQYFIREDVESSALASTHVRFKLMDPDVGRDQISQCNRQGIKQ